MGMITELALAGNVTERIGERKGLLNSFGRCP